MEFKKDELMVQAMDVEVAFGDNTILEHISFEVKRGEIFVILGGSGCGKTALLKHIIGLYTPASGDIRICGESMVGATPDQRLELTRKFGVLYQFGALFGSLTLSQNVALPLEEHTTLSTSMIATLARLKLGSVGLAGFETYLPDSVSGGMKKRAGLARAMALDPEILFLDEPTSGLDPITSAGIDQLILDMRERFGTTMVIVSHELDSVLAIADNVMLLRDGRIAARGSVKEVMERATDPYVHDFFTRKGTKAIR